MGEIADFKLAFPIFLLACEPKKVHPVKDVKVIDVETRFATLEIWGDLFLQAFTNHSRVAEFLKLDDNGDRFYSVLCTRPKKLRKFILMLRDHQSLKVGVIFDPCTPDFKHRVTHSDALRLTWEDCI